MTAPDFWKWFDATTAKAEASEPGKMLKAAGYTVHHTGGGYVCWARRLEDGRYLWICDEQNGPSERLDEPYLVGFYDNKGGVLAQGNVPTLQAALGWCEARCGR